MSSNSGMNIEDVQALGRLMQQIAQDLNNRARELDRRILSVDWVGEDAGVFKSQWWPGHHKALKTALAAIDGLGQSALNNAAEQADISGRTQSAPGVWGQLGAGISAQASGLTWSTGGVPGWGDAAKWVDGAWDDWVSPALDTANFFRDVGKLEMFGVGIGGPLSLFGLANDLGEIYEDAQSGDRLGVYTGITDIGYSAVKNTSWLGYLIGGNLMQMNAIAEASQGFDWNLETLDTVVSASPEEWGKAIWDSRGDIWRTVADVWTPA